MEKRISFFEFQSVKSVAKAIDPHLREQFKIKSQMEKLVEQYKKEQAAIDALEEGVVKIIGFHTSDLVKKVVETTEKGLNVSKYVLTDIVSYDDEAKQYVITTPDENENTEETPKISKKGKAKTTDSAPVEEAADELEPAAVDPFAENNSEPETSAAESDNYPFN